MKLICLALIGLVLVACSGTPDPIVLTSKTQVVVLPDEKMYECPVVTAFPNPKTLTDIQVAKLLIQLHSNNLTCKNNMVAIKTFLEKAKMATTENE